MNTKIKIYIINLEKSKERRDFIYNQFDNLPQKIGYQFFKAVYGKEEPNHPLFSKYNEKKRFARKGHYMSLSQLGCFASHYLLWQKCIELNQGIIVLEDDAIIHSNFPDVLNFIESNENTFEFFWLSPPAPARRNQKGKVVYSSEKLQVARYKKGWGNATGYFINPNAARKLLDYCNEWILDVDIMMERYWENKLDHLAIIPACVEPDFSKESNIPVDKQQGKRSLKTKILREIYKTKDNVNKFIYDLFSVNK
ncbi:UDP-glucose--lipooligosaccharide glucosyltransferase [Haemophilus parahaemolyticus]|uniref:glycosyltransferase family 25 protein n=1 Tax=Haemophilus parahaemolyticus TaxID=735 RepID=UPI000DABEF66|nr:glycosyltransferase family 25 protein [Haemophilus parahaemolyticus]RDE81908.1 UDP-glucose--lipooligosaccharide glucosyltransferase [Haemophilus parahaemolyticus]